MSKYHVYGVGNGLLDMEFSVSNELLEELKIDKGVMTLVDEKQEQEILEKLSHLPCKKSSGGSAANTLVAVSQFGGRGFYSCKVANDHIGHFFLEDLKASGLETNLHPDSLEKGTTGKCLVLVTPDADRTMNTFLGITGELAPKDLVPEAILESDYLYIEGYLVSAPSAYQTALKAKEIAKSSGNVKVAFSLSDPNMVEFFRPNIAQVIEPGLDLIFANETEALKLAQTTNLSDAITYLKGISKSFALTLGARGSLVYHNEELVEIAPVPVKAVDTVGAGDMYAGAFLYGLTQGLTAVQAGNLASIASSRIVTHFGPRLKTEDVQAILDTFEKKK